LVNTDRTIPSVYAKRITVEKWEKKIRWRVIYTDNITDSIKFCW
jgi:hypothetical protein